MASAALDLDTDSMSAMAAALLVLKYCSPASSALTMSTVSVLCASAHGTDAASPPPTQGIEVV